MSDYPDPDEEFELNYGDEFDLLNELPENDPDFEIDIQPKIASRRSLKFDSPESAGQVNTIKSFSTDVEPLRNSGVYEPVAGPSWQDDYVINTVEDQELRKRKIEEIFGDIDDIDFNECSVKKKKNAEDSDLELMSKIVASRQEAKIKAQSLRVLADGGYTSRKPDENISKHVPKWPFMPITTGLGERWYLRLHSDEFMNCEITQIGKHVQSLGLLSASYSNLQKQAEKILKEKTKREQDAAFEKRLQALEESSIDSGCELMSEDEDAVLWVEKYKPRHYLDLLSDESMNRVLLQWLKLWDKVVFGREKKIKSKQKEAMEKLVKNEKSFKSGKGFQKKPFKKFEPRNILDEELDEHNCPKHKIALLCGPPGLGKTTLAHLVAKHAGYNVVEMNASDDRSPDAFRVQLEAATQMQAVLGQQPRPNCLIIDEIDGAPVASIDVLLKFISGKDISKKKGKKKEVKVARRPIICICNDLYVPALRSLRQVSFTLQFPPTASSRLAQRLLEIARKQGIKTDLGTLLSLAEKTQNDIRSCLSVLQFFKGRGSELRLIDVQQSNVGQKDLQKGLFSVWQEIFQIHRPKSSFQAAQAPKSNTLTPLPDVDAGADLQVNEVSRASRLQTVLHTVQSFGDYERVAQGVFENYLNMNLKDTRLEGVVEGLEWFSYFDIVSTRIHRTQNYVLMPYLPYAFVIWHFLFSSFAWPKITYPKAGYEANQKRMHNEQILQTFVRGIAPGVRAYTHASPLLHDVVPYLLDLIVPAIRAVSSQLYSVRERAEMAHAVGVMLDYNLTYVQQRTPEGAYDFFLDPHLEELALFPEGRLRRPLPYSCKQMLAHEVEMERVRRAEARLGPAAAPAAAASSTDSTAAAPAPAAAAAPAAEPPLPNHKQQLRAKPVISNSARVARDFFGRAVQHAPNRVLSTALRMDEIVKSPIWYHFKEGYSNAVRRPVKIKELQ